MPHIDISKDFKDGDWNDLQSTIVGHGKITRATILDKGMTSGRPSVALVIQLDDGKHIVAETSYALFRTVQTVFKHSKAAIDDMEQHPGEYI